MANHLTFGDFRLDPTNECLWQGGREIPLRPKAYALLKHLVDHRGQLVTKQQLLDAVWPGTFVGDAVLKASIRQLREALADDAEAPRYIETSHRRGYRFIAETSATAAPRDEQHPVERAMAAIAPPSVGAVTLTSVEGVLGREQEFQKIKRALERMMQGDRQVVFITGEAGIGKTTLVNAVIEQVAAQGLSVARGQCLEHYGAGEAYLPFLDAFSRLARTPGGEWVVAHLRQHAPAWLLELPSLISAPERAALQLQVGAATRERMLREMAEAVEAMTSQAPLILVLEDLHWSDYSTLDLVAFLARRRDRARVMVIGTYRPVDVIVSDHPLKDVKRELQVHGLCQELPLDYLGEAHVARYLTERFGRHELPKRLTRLIHRRTDGNPLFMVNVVQYLVDERVVTESNGCWVLRDPGAEIESGVPENIRLLIEKQIERLEADERLVLEGASVVGMECSSVAIAAGLDAKTEWVEERCEALVRRHQFLSPARIVELPDGTITARYKFSHVLYLEVPYRLLPAMRRSQIHGRIGQSGEAIYRSRVGEIAAELAMHFEQARDPNRAVKYLLQAAQNATHRSAQYEAAALARRGLQAIESLAPSAERDEREMSLRMILGVALMATRGFAAAEVEHVFHRALHLCLARGAADLSFMVQWQLGLFHYFRAELNSAHEVAEHLTASARAAADPGLELEAHRAMGVTLVDLGRFREALEHLDLVVSMCGRGSRTSFAGQDPLVVSQCFSARALWALGDGDGAATRLAHGLAVARELGQTETLVIAQHFAAHLHQLRGETALALQHAESVIELAEEAGLVLWAAFGHMNRGWARVEQSGDDDGIQELQRGLAAYDATGARLWRAHFLGLLALAHEKMRRHDEALRVVDEAIALVADTADNCSAAELHRIRGDLLRAQAKPSLAVASYERALAIARQQHASAWEQRILASQATVS
jgi:DNA-binding winged helix-turn-helix (wHTH) protein/tetratricopeptide (TPR) repeat protein